MTRGGWTTGIVAIRLERIIVRNTIIQLLKALRTFLDTESMAPPITYDNTSPGQKLPRQGKHRCPNSSANDLLESKCDSLPINTIDDHIKWEAAEGNTSSAKQLHSEASNRPPVWPPVIGYDGGKSGARTGRMPLTDFVVRNWDVMYYGPLKFGFPPQEIQMDVDTGSADLWVSMALLDCLNRSLKSNKQVPTNCPNCDTPQFKPELSASFEASDEEFRAVYVGHSYSNLPISAELIALARGRAGLEAKLLEILSQLKISLSNASTLEQCTMYRVNFVLLLLQESLGWPLELFQPWKSPRFSRSYLHLTSWLLPCLACI
jgi:hypothetical protein